MTSGTIPLKAGDRVTIRQTEVVTVIVENPELKIEPLVTLMPPLPREGLRIQP